MIEIDKIANRKKVVWVTHTSKKDVDRSQSRAKADI